MKTNNSKNKFHSLLTIYFSFSLLLSLLIYVPSSFCELKPLSDDEMSNVTAQGFTSFYVTANTAKVFIDIHVETLGTTESFQGGYHDLYTTGSYGWDVDWSSISLGQDISDPLTFDGLVFLTEFDSVNNINSSDPELKRVIIGSNCINGTVTADMNSFTGVYNPALTGDSVDDGPTGEHRTDLGPTTFNFDSSGDDMGFFIVFTLDGSQSGMQLFAGYNMSETPNPNSLPMNHSTHWW